MKWVATVPSLVESYYSNGIYPALSSFFRMLLGWVPFSVGDLLIFYLLYVSFRFVYRLYKTRFRNGVAKLLQVTAFCSVIYFCFYLFWGLNYYREPLAKNLGLVQSKYTTEQLVSLSKRMITQLNQVHLQITKSDTAKVIVPYSQKEMYRMATVGYDSLGKTYPQLQYSFRSVKNSLMSLVQSYNGTSGYMNPLTGEAQVNSKIPKTGYPTTTCHEMAHQIGFAAENEANFIGFLASIHHPDLYFQYAGYRMATRYVIFEIYKRDKATYQEILDSIHKGILIDFKESSAFWESYKNPFEPLIKKGYNAYLKANKQDKGIQSYNYVVDLLMSYYKVM
jgi:effector-binding domain-containing protein